MYLPLHDRQGNFVRNVYLPDGSEYPGIVEWGTLYIRTEEGGNYKYYPADTLVVESAGAAVDYLIPKRGPEYA